MRATLEGDLARMRDEIDDIEAGSRPTCCATPATAPATTRPTPARKTFEREHEMSLADNSRELLTQTERALERIDDGTYGICESCGNPIGKARLQAFPRGDPVRVLQAARGASLTRRREPPAGRADFGGAGIRAGARVTA